MSATSPISSCFRKKMLSVWKKIALCVAAIVGGILALYGAYALFTLEWDTLDNFANTVGIAIAAFCASAEAAVQSAWTFAITALPWPWNAVVVSVVLVVAGSAVYSWVWCVVKELTDEDWESETASSVAELLVMGLTLGLGLVLGLGLLGLGLLGLELGLLGLGLGKPKVFLFPGAYLHYHKRMKRVIC